MAKRPTKKKNDDLSNDSQVIEDIQEDEENLLNQDSQEEIEEEKHEHLSSESSNKKTEIQNEVDQEEHDRKIEILLEQKLEVDQVLREEKEQVERVLSSKNEAKQQESTKISQKRDGEEKERLLREQEMFAVEKKRLASDSVLKVPDSPHINDGNKLFVQTQVPVKKPVIPKLVLPGVFQGPKVTLTILPSTTVVCGSKFSVQWKLIEGKYSNNHSWIGVYPVHAEYDTQYETYEWIPEKDFKVAPDEQPSGQLEFVAPKTPGEYVIRFFPARKGACIAAADFDVVEPTDSDENVQNVLTLEIPPTVELDYKIAGKTVEPGERVIVEWKISSGKYSNSTSWVGLFPATDETNTNYITYQWISAQDFEQKKEPLTGSLIFYAPQNYGEYIFKFFKDSSSLPLSTSKVLIVENSVKLKYEITNEKKIKVTWTRDSFVPAPYAWIGFYLKDQNDRQYITYEYCAGKKEIYFKAPIKPGDYELRYFVQSYQRSTTTTVKIDGKDIITANLSSFDTITVNIDLVSVDPYYESVIVGVFKVNSNTAIHQFPLRKRQQVLNISAPSQGGEYELRVFVKNNSNPIVKSNKFVI